jgi:hypothetical protein
MGIHCQLVDVYGPNIISHKHFWVWCNAFANSTTDVQDMQQPGWPGWWEFTTDGDMQHAVISWLKMLDDNFFHTRRDALVSQWDKTLNICGNYMQKWWVPKSYESFMHLCKSKSFR